MANSTIEKKISGTKDDIKTGSLKIGSSTYNSGTISLAPSSATANTGGIIDFHYNQSTNYTGRIIEGNTYISIYGKKLALQAGPLEIAYGGTSATTAANARTQLGIDTLYYTKTETDTKLSGKMAITPAAIEIIPGSSAAGHGGFIDFHYNANSADYTTRIIEQQDSLRILGKPLAVKTTNTSSVAGYKDGIHILDGNGSMIGKVQSLWSDSGKHNRGIVLYTVRGTVENKLVIAINDDGEQKVVVSDKPAWQEGLGFLSQTGGTITGNVSITGNISTKGTDLRLGTTSTTSDDSGDIVWYYGNGNEKMRIYAPNNPSSRQGPNFRLCNSSGTVLTTQAIALNVVDTPTFSPGPGVTVVTGQGLGFRSFADRIYILDLSLDVVKEASSSGYYTLGTISNNYAPARDIYTLAHIYNAVGAEVRLSTGGNVGINYTDAITSQQSSNRRIRFTLIWTT